jgi:hypothetical protein
MKNTDDVRMLMFKIYLIIKVWCIHWLQYFKILPNVWYRCEIVLAEIRAKELMEFFRKNTL